LTTTIKSTSGNHIVIERVYLVLKTAVELWKNRFEIISQAKPLLRVMTAQVSRLLLYNIEKKRGSNCRSEGDRA
jgi:hypothetical protein